MPWDEARRAAKEYATARGEQIIKKVTELQDGATDPVVLALEALDLDDDDALYDDDRKELKRITKLALRDYLQKMQETA